MKTKQVVINNSCGDLLTPYWMVEYMKRKGISIYCYEKILNDELDVIEYKLRNPSELNNFEEYYIIDFVNKNLGDTISADNFDNLEDGILLDYFKLIEDREDKDLIEIAKLINDEEKIKIVEIPSDVEYMICDCECSAGEYIEEKHRVWY